MSGSDKKLVNLKEIEGKISPHQEQLDRALKVRAEALMYVKQAEDLAAFIGGKIENPVRGEDWVISREIFPGVEVYFAFYRADDEFPANLKVLFCGERLDLMSGEDLVGIIIPYVSHMLRFVRETNKDKKLPEVCYRV